MSYFGMFPQVFYDNKGDGNYTVMTNLLARVKLVDSAKLNIVDFDYYDIKDGETPEMIAHKYYGDVNYWWIISKANGLNPSDIGLEPATQLRIPTDIGEVLRAFNSENLK